MEMSLRNAMAILFISFVSIVFINIMTFQFQVAKINDYHYSVVNEIESSDFAQSVISEKMNNTEYKINIKKKSLKEDLGIYEVTTKKNIYMPIFNFSKEYVKESTAR
ncbi:MAG: hypothetical protein RSC93_07250 [Erysipelotrichaceae bacterium]